MGLDIRLPIGLLFGLMGAILVGYGILGDHSVYARSLGYNVNLVWGAALVLFAIICLFLARRGSSAMHPAATEPEGRATEEREVRTGLESSSPVVRDRH